MSTTIIDTVHLTGLRSEVARLNAKAVKLGCPELTLTVHAYGTRETVNEYTGAKWTTPTVEVSVTGEAVKLAGWRLLGRKTPMETSEGVEYLVAAVPGETVPACYRDNGLVCDQCHSKRYRKDVFILAHDDGRTAQVGRNCIKDFLGHASPEALLAGAELRGEGFTLPGEADGGYGGRVEWSRPVEAFLAVTSVVVRKMGWVAKSASGPDSPATVNTVLMILMAKPGDKMVEAMVNRYELHADETDATRATKVLDWARALPATGFDYSANLGVACRALGVTLTTSGIVASALSSYTKQVEREELARRTREKSVSKHVGTVGIRQGFPGLRVAGVRSFESNFGVRTLVRFEDTAGNILVWWASGDAGYEEGEVLDVTGTVKSHEDYRGTPQTVLSRVAKGLPAVKKPKRVKAVA